jgi:hypothetical protein
VFVDNVAYSPAYNPAPCGALSLGAARGLLADVTGSPNGGVGLEKYVCFAYPPLGRYDVFK